MTLLVYFPFVISPTTPYPTEIPVSIICWQVVPYGFLPILSQKYIIQRKPQESSLKKKLQRLKLHTQIINTSSLYENYSQCQSIKFLVFFGNFCSQNHKAEVENKEPQRFNPGKTSFFFLLEITTPRDLLGYIKQTISTSDSESYHYFQCEVSQPSPRFLTTVKSLNMSQWLHQQITTKNSFLKILSMHSMSSLSQLEWQLVFSSNVSFPS